MASSQSLFATIPGLEGLIAEPTHAALPPASLASAAAAPTPPRPVAPSPPGGSPFPPHPTPSSMASRGALLEGEGAPGSGHRVGSLADQRAADAASLSPSKQAKEDGVAVAISLFSEDDESSHLLQRRLAFLAPGMQVSAPHGAVSLTCSLPRSFNALPCPPLHLRPVSCPGLDPPPRALLAVGAPVHGAVHGRGSCCKFRWPRRRCP